MLPTTDRSNKEAVVAIVAVFQDATLTKDQYEETVRKLAGKSQMESPADWPVEGLLAHIAGEGKGGFRVVDVWESEDAFGRFGEKLMPILQELGIHAEPEIYPANTFVSAKSS
jgi:hypothetical protein